MIDTDSIGTPQRHHRGHSRVAQQALDDARRCDEHNARRRVAVTRVRALLVELGRATHVGERLPVTADVAATAGD
jgi:hypothetical protein